MTNTVEVSPEFKRDLKPLLKKYHSLRTSIENLQQAIIENPYIGVSYGSNIYKVRLADESKGGGKSGGFRVLYYHLDKTKEGITVLLTNIFDKSDTGTIKKADAVKQLQQIIKEHKERKP